MSSIIPSSNHERATPQNHSPAQKEFLELTLKDNRALPTELYQNRFIFNKGADPRSELTSAVRALNWLTAGGDNPLLVTGPTGIGKSVLGWQIMNEAENKGMVPIMMSAADIVMGRDLDKPDSSRPLPLSSINSLRGVLDKLDTLKTQELDYGKSVVLIIDGIDPDHYPPDGNSLLNRIHSHGIRVVLNVDSERSSVKGPSIHGYYKQLNPDGLATSALILKYDGIDDKTMMKQHLTFDRPRS